MQSRRLGNPTPITPQKSPQSSLTKSAPINGSTDERKLAKGNTLHQIFSNPKYIFSVSSTLEKLYRYRFDPLTSEVVEILVFKRVRNGESEMVSLRSINPKARKGTPTPFNGMLYDVYGLISNGYIRGYMLYARTAYGYEQKAVSERMYYAFKKCEKKGR